MMVAAAADYLTSDFNVIVAPSFFNAVRAAGSVRVHSIYSIMYYQGHGPSKTKTSTASGHMTDWATLGEGGIVQR